MSTSSPRIYGNKLSFKLGETSAAEEYRCDITAVSLEYEEADSDAVTYCDAERGGVAGSKLVVGLTQSTASESFHQFLWDNAGTVVPVTYAPHQNAAPSPEQPHFVGFVKLPIVKPTLGGEATINGSGFTTEAELQVVDADGNAPAELTKKTTAA